MTNRVGARTRMTKAERERAHWRANLRLMAWLLALWFAVPYGLGIVFVEPLNRLSLGGFPLGFWFAQQGSIYVFVALIAVYALGMDRLDRRYRDGGEADEAEGR